MEIAKLMIGKGAHNWERGLCGACRGGSVEMAEFMISCGATNLKKTIIDCVCSHSLEILEFMVSRGMIDLEPILFCQHSSFKFFQYAIEHGAVKFFVKFCFSKFENMIIKRTSKQRRNAKECYIAFAREEHPEWIR